MYRIQFIVFIFILAPAFLKAQTIDSVLSGTISEHYIKGHHGFVNEFTYRVEYPYELREKRDTSLAIFEMVIDTLGCIRDVKILIGVTPELDKIILEQLEAIKCNWKPYSIQGKKYRYRVAATHYFELQ